MSGIYGALNLEDSDREFLNTLGQQVVYAAIQQVLAEHNANLALMIEGFVDEVTEDFKFLYKRPGGGRLQRGGAFSRPGATKAVGEWNVALPLENFGDRIAKNRIDLAYMTLKDLDVHLDNIMLKDVATVRYEILKAMLNNQQDSFEDERKGTLLIEPLANNDATLYPPVIGSETEATENHYLEAGYVAADISDTNNPIVTLRDELEEHSENANIAAFINKAQVTKIEALADYESVNDPYITPGANANQVTDLPQLPGVVIGRAHGVWIVKWDWIPAGYIKAIDLNAPQPLRMRVHPADTGLPRGLELVAENEEYPLSSAYYERHFGVGVVNRLNGVVIELANGGSYTVPSGY